MGALQAGWTRHAARGGDFTYSANVYLRFVFDLWTHRWRRNGDRRHHRHPLCG